MELGPGAVHLIGLGCGGGQKEAALLRRLRGGDRPVSFSASDVSSGMVITALQAAWEALEADHCSGVVCDLAETRDLHEFLESRTPAGARRVVTFFGMIPNFEPEVLDGVLRCILRPGDLLLSSANLAPGNDYPAGVEQVLPQYDNALTREWLEMLLDDLGIRPNAGRTTFAIEESPARSGLLRITAGFEFRESVAVRVEGEAFDFKAGTTLQLFFSYRHTVDTVGTLFAASSLKLLGSWVSNTGEEGVFLAGAQNGLESA